MCAHACASALEHVGAYACVSILGLGVRLSCVFVFVYACECACACVCVCMCVSKILQSLTIPSLDSKKMLAAQIVK